MRGELEGLVIGARNRIHKEDTRQTVYLLGTTTLYDGRTGRYEQQVSARIETPKETPEIDAMESSVRVR